MGGLTTKETARLIKYHLKKEFPEITWSVTSESIGLTNSINISIMSYNRRLSKEDYLEVGYGFKFYERLFKNKEITEEGRNIVQKVIEIANSYNYSDTMRDYFDIGFSLSVSIGKPNKPFQLKNDKEIKR